MGNSPKRKRGGGTGVRGQEGSRETLASSAYQRLRQDIITARLPPGVKLRMRDLCERYGIGLSPIREALNRMSRDGLVQQSDQRGFSVAPLSEQDLVDLTLARCWINGIALRASIERGDATWEESVLLAHHRMTRTPMHLETGAINPAFEITHRAFHSALIAACGSTYVIKFCEQLFDNADRYRQLARQRPDRTKNPVETHRPIMEAVLARDAAAAVELLNDHFQATADLGIRELKMAGATTRKHSKKKPSRSRTPEIAGDGTRRKSRLLTHI